MRRRGCYYNEIDSFAAEWLRQLIAAGLVPDGDVDERDIRDVQPADIGGYVQCHFFAGIGGWAAAGRIAGWPDDRPIWTGSCPCQPFSVAGKRAGQDDPRHLWPDFFRLIRASRPAVVMGEQVARAAGRGWFDGVRSDLEGIGYASRAVDVPACAVDAPHIRSRLYWCAVADRDGPGWGARTGQFAAGGAIRGDVSAAHDGCSGMADGDSGLRDGRTSEPVRRPGGRDASQRDDADERRGPVVNAESIGWREGIAEAEIQRRRPAFGEPDVSDCRLEHADGAGWEGRATYGGASGAEQPAVERADVGDRPNGSWWAGAEWLICHDGKARRAEPRIPLLVARIPGRVDMWRGFGNAISPPLAAEVMKAWMEVMP